MAQTMFEKIWSSHVVATREDGRELIYLDRHVIHEMHAPTAYRKLEASGRQIRRPELTFGMVAHKVSTKTGRTADTLPGGAEYIEAMREGSHRLGIHLFDLHDPTQGIDHVVTPEQGIVLPGSTYAGSDSHSCTVGALGALAFGLGTTDVEHVLATQMIALAKPKTMRIHLTGHLQPGVVAKDVILRIIGELGIGAGSGYAVEFAGSVIDEMEIEGRLTLCNMSVEFGARTGFIAPDEKTYAYLASRPYTPEGAEFEVALERWKTVPSDPGATFDREITIDCNELEPQVTWGIDPSHVIAVTGYVPDPSTADASERERLERALAYQGLSAGMAIAGVPISRVFIGSCTNARLSDLERAAAVIQGRHVAPNVTVLIVPGSTSVKRAAEALGLDEIFITAGFGWGESGCSMCGAASEHHVDAGERSLSTTNRNFENRQGVGVRTHLVSPEMAAAGALTGEITDARALLGALA